MRKPIISEQAPKPRGTYTPAIVASGPTVYVSAQGPFDPATDQVVAGGLREQAEQVFKNVGALLEAAGSSWQQAVKVTVYLADWSDFAAMNEVYQQFVSPPYPARSTVPAKIGNSLIAVDCIAVVPEE